VVSFILAKPAGDLPPLPPAPELPVPEPLAEPVPGLAAEPMVEPNQVFFCFFHFVVRVLVCFVYWPSVVGRPFVVFFGILVSFVLFCFVLVGFVIWGGFFHATCPLGMLVCRRFLSLFLLFFSGVISYSLGPFMFAGFYLY